jgi:hypothetical protein
LKSPRKKEFHWVVVTSKSVRRNERDLEGWWVPYNNNNRGMP